MSTDLDRRLAGWFASAGVEDVPNGLLEDVFGVTRRARQRRGVLGRFVASAAEWWHAPAILRVAPQRLAYLVVLGLLLVAAALAIAAVGTNRPAPPFGLAANGLIAFGRDDAVLISSLDGTGISTIATVPKARGPVYAPDGRHLAFYRAIDGAFTIMVALANGDDPVAVSTGIGLDDLAMDTPMSWSPDSRRIVFGGLLDGQRRIFVATIDGSPPVAVGDDGLSRIDPAWSPDGAWIAFHGFHPAEDAAAGLYWTSAGLYLIRPDGRDQTLLVGGRGGDFIYRKPRWLPDPGRSVLAYAIGVPNAYDIAVFDVDSMRQTVISDVVWAELWPAWAPDGSELAWVGSDARIRVARPDGTGTRIFASDIDYEVVWSPDGRYLLGWMDERRSALAVMSSDGSSATSFFPMAGRSRSHWSWQRRAP